MPLLEKVTQCRWLRWLRDSVQYGGNEIPSALPPSYRLLYLRKWREKGPKQKKQNLVHGRIMPKHPLRQASRSPLGLCLVLSKRVKRVGLARDVNWHVHEAQGHELL